MKKLTEGRKMFLSVMAIFVVYGAIFIIFDDYDRRTIAPLNDAGDWHLFWFSIVVVGLLALLLHRYARRMDQRISRDQAEQQTLMRRQLTQNIAHELKTPVASIMGYTETLLDHPTLPPEQQRLFLERSLTQSQRLTALLNDLSTLNRMDYAPDMITREDVDLSHLVADIAQETELARQQRGMQLVNQLPAGIVIRGNTSLLYSVFRNLIDNAISYAGRDTTISISAVELGDCWQFTFSDNGVGVERQHISRLFERFYRVDKGRSRSMGGTGLGLAIVKNAIQLHGGTVAALSGPTGGLCFDFTLKKR